MKIAVSTNAAEVSRTLRRVFEDQLPFATAKALNRLANEVQQAQQEGMEDSFTLRRATWAKRSIKRGREDWANKKKLEAVVRVETPGDASRSQILTQHEEGGTKRPTKSTSLAVPDKARRNPKMVVPKAKRPRAYAFQHVGGPRYQSSRDPRVFMIRNAGGTGGIFRRMGRKGDTTETLFRLTRKAELSPRLKFEETATRTAQARFAEVFREEFSKAIRSAK